MLSHGQWEHAEKDVCRKLYVGDGNGLEFKVRN